MSELNNPDNITLFKAVSIKHYIVFYNKELLRESL